MTWWTVKVQSDAGEPSRHYRVEAATWEQALAEIGGAHNSPAGEAEAVTGAEYASVGEFYAADRRREHSPEADYGEHWRNAGLRWPAWRMSYVLATGEVYAVRQGGTAERWVRMVRVLGVVPADPVPVYYRTLNAILDGWADPDVSGFDLAWVAGRLADATAADEPDEQPAEDHDPGPECDDEGGASEYRHLVTPEESW